MSPDRRAAGQSSVLPETHPDSSDAGFSLVEVMTALIVFALVSAGALTLVLRAAGTIRGNQDRVIAAAIAASELDRVRELGSSNVELGRTERVESTESGDFTVTTDATWVPLGVAADPCDVGDGVNVNQSYLRIHVEVAGGDTEVPQTSDTLLYPDERAQWPGVGTMTIQVADSAGNRLSGVSVTGANGAGSSFSQTTGAEGCVFIPDLIAGSNWEVGVARTGFRSEAQGGESVSGVSVDALTNSDLSFTIEQPGSFTVTAGSEDFPLPSGTTFTYQRDTTTVPAQEGTTFPAVVDDLWPDQYLAWLGTCPLSVTSAAATIFVVPGGSSSVALPAGQVEFVAEAGSVITVTSADSGCGFEFALPEVGDDFLVKSSVPYGTWQASVVPSETPGDQTFYVDGNVSPCSVSWEVPSAATPTASPSESPTSDPSPSTTPTDDPSPTPTVTLPEVSEPCPTAEPTP